MTEWDLYRYDVWGNAVDGYDVNDVYRVRRERLNTVDESPSDDTIRSAFALPPDCTLEWQDWDWVEILDEDGCPYGRIQRHASFQAKAS